MTPTLLLVDDNPSSLKLLNALCEASGYQTVTAYDGLEALAILEQREVQLLITDILMPNVDGYYLCYRVRTDPRWRDLPIIIYTATYTSMSEEAVARQMGADRFIRKPAPLNLLLQAIDDLLTNPQPREAFTYTGPDQSEAMHQYSSDLVNKLESRNIELEQIRENLERLVSDRTLELQKLNEDLQATNEELLSANEELSATNDKLVEATEIIREQSDRLLRQKDEQLNRVLDSSDHIVWSMDLTGVRPNFVSGSCEKVLGMKSELLSKGNDPWTRYVHEEDLEQWQRASDALYSTFKSQADCRIRDGRGNLLWMHFDQWIITDETGQPVRYEGVCSDITEIMNAELALRNERKLLRLLVDNLPDYVFVKDTELRHVLVNKAFASMLGYSEEAPILGKTAFDYFGNDATALHQDDLHVLSTGEAQLNKEEVVKDAGEKERILLTTKVPLRDESGKTMGIVGISRDVTDYREKEQEVRAYQEKLDIIFKNTEEGIMLVGQDGKVVLFNDSLRRFLTEATGESPVKGKYLWEVIPEERRSSARELFERSVRGERLVVEATVEYGGERVVHEVRYQPIEIGGSVKYVCLNSTDITEKMRNELLLRRNKYLLDKANEVARIGYWSYDPALQVSEFDEVASEIFGLTVGQERTFDSYLAVVHPQDKERVTGAATETLRERKTYNIQHRIIRPADGTLRWIHEIADFVTDFEGADLLVGIVQDITAQKESERLVLAFNERFEIVSRATNDAIWDWDVVNDTVQWNHGIHTIFGYDESAGDSLPGWQDLIHPEDLARVQGEVGDTFRSQGSHWVSNFRYRCADGSYRFVLNRAYVLYEAGNAVRMIGALQDVSEQKEYEENLSAMARELADLIEHANSPIFGTNLSGQINEWNDFTARLTGYTKDEVTNLRLADVIGDEGREAFAEAWSRGVHEPVNDLEVPIVSKLGNIRTVLLNITPRRNLRQQIIGTLMVGQDITELTEYRHNLESLVKERTRELNEALSKEREVVEMKSRFVSIASHEFRTPLSSILLATGVLRKHLKKLTPSQVDDKLEAIEKQVNHMTYLLNDILTVSRSEAGKIQAKIEPLILDTFFRALCNEVESGARTHRIDYNNRCTLRKIRSDEKLLRNIIINLLTNAIKFSPGSQSVSLSLHNTPSEIILEVADQGIGILEEDIPNLFMPFNRGGNVGGIEGTGLGLSIVKKAVEMLGGFLQVYSQPGRGTRIQVTLPVV